MTTITLDQLLTAFTVLIGIFGAIGGLYAVKQYYNARRKDSIDRRTKLQQIFPFNVYDKTHIDDLEKDSIGPFSDIPYTRRRSDFDLAKLLEQNQCLLVTGRNGIGKSREVIEALSRFDKKESDPITIFAPDRYICRPHGVDNPGGMFKRPILLVEGIDNYYANDDTNYNQELEIDSFHDRLVDTVAWFKNQNPRLRIIFTAQNSNFINSLNKKEAAFWTNITQEIVPEFNKQGLDKLIRNVAKYRNLKINDNTVDYIRSKCDATSKGIIEGIYNIDQSRSGVEDITLQNAATVSFTWPRKWRQEVFDVHIAKNSNSKAIFDALVLLESLWIPPIAPLVTDLSARMRSRWLGALFRKRIKHHIQNDISSWVKPVNGRYVCQDAYLHSIEPRLDAIPLLIKSINKLSESSAIHLAATLITIIKRIYRCTGDKSYAEKILTALSSKCQNEIGFLEAMYAASMLSGNYDNAIDTAAKITCLTNSSPPALIKQSTAYTKAASKTTSKDKRASLINKAIEASSTALQKDADFQPALRSLMIQYGLQNQYSSSINLGKRLVELSGRAKDWYYLGVAYGKNNDFDLSIEALSQALNICPDDIEALNSLVINLSNAGKIQEQIAPLERLIELCPYNNDYLVQLAAVHNKLQSFKEAIALAKKALADDPTNQKYIDVYGTTLASSGDYEEAKKHIARSIVDLIRIDKIEEEIFGSDSLPYSERIDKLKQTVEEHPDSYKAWQILGAMQRKEGERMQNSGDDASGRVLFEQSQRSHVNAIDLATTQGANTKELCSMWYAKGRAQLSLELVDDACLSFKTALQHNPNHENCLDYFRKYSKSNR